MRYKCRFGRGWGVIAERLGRMMAVRLRRWRRFPAGCPRRAERDPAGSCRCGWSYPSFAFGVVAGWASRGHSGRCALMAGRALSSGRLPRPMASAARLRCRHTRRRRVGARDAGRRDFHCQINDSRVSRIQSKQDSAGSSALRLIEPLAAPIS